MYQQHDNDDVIIPDHLARPLVISSHLLLISAIIGLIYKRYGLFIVLILVYGTSVWHWYKPRFTRIARYMDYIAVFTAIVYGSYVASSLETIYIYIWFGGLGIIGVIFITNETMYYYQTKRKPYMPSAHKSNESTNEYENKMKETNSSASNADVVTDPELCIRETNETGSSCSCLSLNPTEPFTPERDMVYKRVVAVHLFCVHVFANALALVVIIGASNEKI